MLYSIAMNSKNDMTQEELENFIPGVSLEDRHNLIAYSQAKRRLSGSLAYRANYTPEQRQTDEFVAFSLGRNARRTNKKVIKALLNDLLTEAELIIMQSKCQRWEIVTSDLGKTSDKLVQWTQYLGVNTSLYSQHEENNFSGNYLINLNFYNLDNLAMLETNAGWYDKNGKRIKDLATKRDAVYHLGYLLSKRKTPTIIRPRSANRKDVEFLTKLVSFYESNAGTAGGYGLRGDIRNTIHRFTRSYQWPNMQQLMMLDSKFGRV